MILPGEILEIGRIIKPHGIKGELSATVDPDVDIASLQCIVLDMDGIFVPFFVNSFRRRGNQGVLLSIDGLRDENDAAELSRKTIYALKKDIPFPEEEEEETDPDRVYLEELAGYEIIDSSAGRIGEISDIDDTTENLLFIVAGAEGRQLLIPATGDFIDQIDKEERTVTMTLPEGLLSL